MEKLQLLLLLCVTVSLAWQRLDELQVTAPLGAYFHSAESMGAEVGFVNIPNDTEYEYGAYLKNETNEQYISRGDTKRLKDERIQISPYYDGYSNYDFYIKLTREDGNACDAVKVFSFIKTDRELKQNATEIEKTCFRAMKCTIIFDLQYECIIDGVNAASSLNGKLGLYVGVPVAIFVVVIAIALALYWIKRRRNTPEEHIYATVEYLELQMPSSSRPIRPRDEPPYVDIIGVMASREDYKEHISPTA